MPKKIDQLEQEIESLTHDMASPEFYQQDSSIVAETGNKLKNLQEELDQCFARWEELEA